MWGTAFLGASADSLDLHARWGILSRDVRDVEVVWSPVHRDALGQLLLEQLQVTYIYTPFTASTFFFFKITITASAPNAGCALYRMLRAVSSDIFIFG